MFPNMGTPGGCGIGVVMAMCTGKIEEVAGGTGRKRGAFSRDRAERGALAGVEIASAD